MNSSMIQVLVSNNITLTGLSESTKAALQKSLTIENKDFYKFQKMGIWAPRDFKYWSEPKGYLPSHGALVAPRGCKTKLLSYLKSSGNEYEVVDNFVEKPAKLGISRPKLREYQVPIVESIVAQLPSEGIIVSSTGSGKTIMALEIIHRLGLTATILCQNTVLADQFCLEAKEFYYTISSRIDGKHKEVGDLTIATFQSLYANSELLARLAENTSVLVVDEAQGIVSKERRKVLEAFKPKHLLGLTATPAREDSLTPAIFFLLGHPIAKHEMAQAVPEVEVIRTGVEIPMSDTYNDIVTSMVENESRNKLLAGLILGEALKGRKTLVLTKRIKHYELLRALLSSAAGMYYIDSGDNNRNELLTAFKKGEKSFNVICGTTSLLSVGTDIPNLDTLILACDMKSSVLTTQSVGRILRLFEGKPTPRIIDLYDDENPILANQFKARLALYKSKSWEIKHYFKCPKCKAVFTYYKREYLPHNKQCYGKN